MSLLLTGADILSLRDGAWQVLHGHSVGIRDGVIDYLGAGEPAGKVYAEKKQLNGRLLMPGLYNMHTHTPMTLLRGLGSDLPLDRWLHEAMFPVEDRLEPPDISVGTRLALLEMLASGVVSFSDMYNFTETTVAEVEQAGMKANLNRPVLAFDPSVPYAEVPHVQESLAFFEAYKSFANGRILAEFSLHAEYTSHPALVRAYAEDCARLGARMHLHLSETQKEHEACKARHGKTPARYFYDLGVLDNPTLAAHCVWVEPEDIAIMAEKGVTAVHNPTSNMKLGSGYMPLAECVAAGVNVALGTDGAASNNNLNLFEEMHLAAVLHKGYHLDPVRVPPNVLLRMATVNAAQAQGRADCGNIAEGMRADIIALNMDAPHMLPAHDIPALLVYSAQASDVVMTMVDGKVLYENGAYTTIDFDRVKFDLNASLKRLF